MAATRRPSLASSLALGALSGLAGTAAMTAFQKLVEMPITGREDSYAPADFAEKVFSVSPKDEQGRNRLNYLAHFGIGTGWGVAYAFASRSGLSWPRAVAAAFAGVYTGDVALNTALGLYKPWEWSLEETAVDVVDKLVQAGAAGAAFEVLSSG